MTDSLSISTTKSSGPAVKRWARLVDGRLFSRPIRDGVVRVASQYHLQVKIGQGTFEYKYIPANSLEQLASCMPREVLSYTVIDQVQDQVINPVSDDELFLELIHMISHLEHSEKEDAKGKRR